MKEFQLGAVVVVVVSLVMIGCRPAEPEPVPAPDPVRVDKPVAVLPPDPVPVPEPEPEPEPVKPAYTGVQSTPLSVIDAFLKAALTNGVKEMTEMSMERIHGDVRDPEWLALWNAYRVSSIGPKMEPVPTPSPGADKTVRVLVVLQDPTTGEILEERLGVSFKTDRWYWDEK